MNIFHRLVLLLSLSAVVSGCTGLVVGGATTAGLAVHDRRSAETVWQDQQIELKAYDIINNDESLSEQSHIGITSYNHRVLLSGQAASDEVRRRFAEQVARIDRVAHVYNEVTLEQKADWGDDASDTYLTAKVKLKLIDVKLDNFDLTRVKVVTSKSTVFLMGLLTQEEADAVTEVVRYVGGVEKVVRLFEIIQR